MQFFDAGENYYQLLFEVIPLPIFVYDLTTFSILNANQTAMQKYGYSREEFLSLSIENLLKPDDFQLVRAAVTAQPLTPRLKDYWKHRMKNGEFFDAEVYAYPVPFQNRPARLVIITDITERLHYESQLRETRAFYQLLFEKSPLPVWVYDRDTLMFLDVNQAAVNSYGYSREEFLSMPITEIRPATDVDRLLTEIQKGEESTKFDRLWRHRKKDGTVFDVEINFFPILFNDRQATIVTAQDVTARRKIEMALRDSEERYRKIYENASDAIYTHDLEGNFTSVNEAIEKIMGYSRRELLSMNISDLILRDDLERARHHLNEKADGGTTLTVYEIRVCGKDGRVLPVEVSTTLMYRDGQPIGVQGIARDLTRRKYVEEQLREAQKMEALGRLAGRLSHDFNNLLTVIQGYTALLLKRTSPDDFRHHYLEQIKLAGEGAGEFTRKLMALSSQQISHPQLLNLNEVVMKMGNMLRGALGEDIELNLIVDPDIGLIRADNIQLDHAIMNLILNARDAIAEQGLIQIATTAVEIEDGQITEGSMIPVGKYIRLSVTDTGCGIPPEIQENLFEPFFTTKEKGKGTGLGLFNVRKIIKQAKGFITLNSTPGKGTSFYLYFPLVEEAESSISEHPVATDRRAAGERILLVEDDPVVKTLVHEILVEAGYSVLEASDAASAIELARAQENKIDLLLTDVHLPKINGRELAEKIGDLIPSNRVLLMSGYTDDARISAAVSSSHLGFLQKPFTAESLLAKIREILDRDQYQLQRAG